MKKKLLSSKSQLAKFKGYYRLEDAAKVLSAELEEEVSVRDVHEYALHGALKLSVMLGFQPAERAVDNVDPSVDHLRLDGFYHIDPDSSGFRELLVYESMGFEDPLAILSLWLVREVDEPRQSYRLCKYGGEDAFEWDEDPDLPEIVVRRCDLEDFILIAKGIGVEIASGKEPKVHPRRKNSYIKLINVFIKELGLNLPEERYKAAFVLQAMLDKHGESLCENTLEKIVREVRGEN